MQGPCNKPFVLYGKGGSGKTAMLSIAASKGLTEWFKPGKPLLIIRYHSFQLSKLIPSVDCIVLYCIVLYCIVFCLTQNYCCRLCKEFKQQSVDRYIKKSK
jgi:hypothetical protein